MINNNPKDEQIFSKGKNKVIQTQSLPDLNERSKQEHIENSFQIHDMIPNMTKNNYERDYK